ncbi:conjugal transfer protein TrbL [Ornithinimicrobium panacihumi]|uniref:conjugal transfer protein TrbL n=1 Tax=Ornithinimicrobium panacihumi TaxID=2008449 RepID=UPI003F8A3271
MGVCDIPVISTVCDVAGDAAGALISAPFDWLAQAMGAAAGWLFEAVWNVFDTTTLVDVTSDGYVSVYNLVFGIAVFIMLIFFCLQLITGLVKRDPGALSRAALGLAKSVLGSFVVITLTGLALEIVDQLCTGIIQAGGETTETMGDKITLLVAGLTGISIAAPGVGAIITIFLAGLAITSAAIVWLSLLVRKALLLVAIVMAPLAFSGSSWDASRSWVSKWAMFVIALIASKLVLVVMFLVAVTQVSAPIEADLASVSDPIAGVVLMAMAGFAPYLTYKFISFVGFDMYHAIGSEQDAKQSLNRPMPVPSKPQGGDPQKVLDGGSSKPGTGGSSGAKGAPPAKPTPAPAASSGAGSGAGAGAGAGAGGAGASGAAAGGAVAAPIAAGLVAAKIAKDSFEAGPKAAGHLADQADAAADGAGQPGNAGTPAAPSMPMPKNPTPPSDLPPSNPKPPAPKPGKE